MVAVRAKGSPTSRPVRKRAAFRRVGSAAIVAALCAIPVVEASAAQAYSSQQWALDYLKATQDWQISKGSDVTVAVLDSGVAPIPDLNGQVLSGADFASGATSSGNGRTDTDSDGHGTGMASVIAANGTNVAGLAPASKILPVRIDASGKGTMFASNVAAGIQFATKAHAGVINLSIGGGVDFGPDVRQAVLQAVSANIVVVAAAGNESASTVDYPAAYPGVVAVGAIDQSGQAWAQSNTGAQVALAAPGVQIYRDNNLGQQGTSSGTSEATAYVSAAAALVRSAHPDWTAGQVIRDLIGTADPAPGQTAGQHSDQYGYGIIDPLKALQAPAPSDTSNPLLGAAGGATSTATSGAGSTASSPAGSTATSAGTSAAAGTSSGSSHTGLIIGVVAAVVVIAIIMLVLLAVARSRRGRGGPRPPYGPGPGMPYPQQHPYGQPQQPQQPQSPPQAPRGPQRPQG